MEDPKNYGLQTLLEDYPELSVGLSELFDGAGNEPTALVGVITLLKLRLRSVVRLLPGAASDDFDPAPGPASSD